MSPIVTAVIAAISGSGAAVAVMFLYLVVRGQDATWAAKRAARDVELARRAAHRSRRQARVAHRAAHRAAQAAGTRPVVHVTWRQR